MRQLLHIMLLTALTGIWFSCSQADTENQTLELSVPTLLIHSAAASTADFTIYTHRHWQIETDAQTWYTLSQTEGTGETRINVQVDASPEFEVRKAEIRIRTASESKSICIEQNRNTGIQIDVREYEIEARGGTAKVVIGANVDIRVSLTEEAGKWLSATVEPLQEAIEKAEYSSNTGISQQIILLRAERNYSGVSRSAEVHIAPKEGENQTEEIITVVQQAEKDDETVAEGANCYLLQRGHTVEIPISRSNFFWGSVDGGFIQENLLGATDAWVADVIWQDQPDPNLIRFLDAEGRETKQAAGVGPGQKIRIRANGACGNVIIGLHRKGTPSASGNYLWSWHIWITDYNPDACQEEADLQKSVYEVPGGALHRYTGSAWENGIYAQSFIMDRNLGAFSAQWNGKNDSNGILFYLYGRKDPMPVPQGNSSNVQGALLYDIDGKPLAEDNPNNAASLTVADVNAKTKEPFTYAYSVMHPTQLLWRKGLLWCSSIRNPEDHLWNSPEPNSSSHRKSLYDPCPKGWKLPEITAYDEVATQNKPYVDNISAIDGYNLGYTPVGSAFQILFPLYGYMDNQSISAKTKWRIYTGLCMINTASAQVATLSADGGNTGTTSYASNNKYYPVRCIRETDNK